jgi:hypothetical protein
MDNETVSHNESSFVQNIHWMITAAVITSE